MIYLFANLKTKFQLLAIKDDLIVKAVEYSEGSGNKFHITTKQVLSVKHKQSDRLARQGINTYHEISLEEVKEMMLFAEITDMKKTEIKKVFVRDSRQFIDSYSRYQKLLRKQNINLIKYADQ